ncbi:uncharacterized protein LOC62_05G007750 [Vanrija pseudolonga]|uniref:Selenoprotein O n=1 Tax=Vanrija pseudolonga TaxID=143232 RepID=A0AAF0YCI5_9TREE|nr:hypothetical protein LOC62_05G007750 [Vanrija pseudolonga]
MRPLVGATAVAAVTLALVAMWRRAPAPGPQHAALTRLIASLDALADPYALSVDHNGALVVQILDPPPEPEDESYKDMLTRWDWLARFNTALEAETDALDGYVVTYAVGQRVPHKPDAVLNAGLSPRPGRFTSRAAAREWFPALLDDGKCRGVDDGEHEGDAHPDAADAADAGFRAAYAEHKGNFTSPAWRALQRAELQNMLDCLDRSGTLYELLVGKWGELAICPFGPDEEAEAGDGDEDEAHVPQRVHNALSCISPYVSAGVMQSYREYESRRVKRGVAGRGRYDPDDIFAAGLSFEPGNHPLSPEDVEERRREAALHADEEVYTCSCSAGGCGNVVMGE